jgi:hypothetical protein
VEQRHQGEDYPGHHTVRFPVHGRSSQIRVTPLNKRRQHYCEYRSHKAFPFLP